MTDRILLGVDVGGTRTKWVTSRIEGEGLDSGSRETPTDGPTSVIELIAEILAEAGSEVSSVGIAVPGHVDVARGRTGLIPNLAGDWNGFAFEDAATARFGLPAAIVNDARAFAIAELSVGSAANLNDALFATIGTGVGGAIALDRTLRRNATDSVGELGHSIVVRGGEQCGCGANGCAEAYAGIRAITRRYFSRTARGLDIEAIRAAADAGDDVASEIIADAAWAVGCAISNLAVQLGVAEVVLGGGLGTRWPEFATEVRAQLASRASLIGDGIVHVSALGDHAGALGAAVAGARYGHESRKDEQ